MRNKVDTMDLNFVIFSVYICHQVCFQECQHCLRWAGGGQGGWVWLSVRGRGVWLRLPAVWVRVPQVFLCRHSGGGHGWPALLPWQQFQSVSPRHSNQEVSRGTSRSLHPSLVCSCRLSNATNCGRKRLNRILGGVVSGEHEFPWHCALLNPDLSFYGCSAVLLSCDPVVIVTAAHCFSQ